MLFLNQIKREFSQTSWKTGQIFYREERVKEVRLRGDAVVAKIEEADASYFKIEIIMARGTIAKSSCQCATHHIGEAHCRHIAALSIWVIERGSLLRAGIGSEDDGVAESFIVPDEEDVPEVLTAEPVAFVRPTFAGKRLHSVTVEAGFRYRSSDVEHVVGSKKSPEIKKSEIVFPLSQLLFQGGGKIWKAPDGKLYQPAHEYVPVLKSLDAAKIIYQGQAALEQLALLMMHAEKAAIVYHSDLADVSLASKPLRLVGMHIGRKADKSRPISYNFANDEVSISSDEMNRLSELGRLSTNFVWIGNKIYRLSTSLAQLARLANRSGVAGPESSPRVKSPTGFIDLEDNSQQPLHPLAAYRLSLEVGVEDFSVDQDWKEFHEWRKNFERKDLPELPNIDYGFDLREYQKNGLNWLWSLSHRGLAALLADDMGLGKTHQVMAFLSSMYSSKEKPEHPSLVIAPTSVVASWAHKLERYDTGLKWTVFHGKGRVMPSKDVKLVLTTYGILQKESALRERPWHVVILDEAQAIKNATTISARASRVLKCKFRLAMTGTPVENQASDLWSIMEFLLPGYLGSLPRFKRLYGYGREIPTKEQASTLKRLVSPFLLRRTKSQVLTELPEKTEEVVRCEMTSLQKKQYRAFLNSSEAAKLRADIEAGEKIDYAGVLSMLTRLKQVCDHPRLPAYTTGKIKKASKLNPEETGKWEVFVELLEEALRSDLKIVVFTQYLGMMDVIGLWLKKQNIEFTELRGDTRDRGDRIKKFQENHECKVFLCSLLAGGLGIDLTAASVCIHFDRWWNPAKENQATDRLHRIGQTRGVQVFKLQCPETIEDRIAEIIQSKKTLSGVLIEESPLGLKAFSRDELLALLTDTLHG